MFVLSTVVRFFVSNVLDQQMENYYEESQLYTSKPNLYRTVFDCQLFDTLKDTRPCIKLFLCDIISNLILNFLLFIEIFDVMIEGQQFEFLGFTLNPVIRMAIMRKVCEIFLFYHFFSALPKVCMVTDT